MPPKAGKGKKAVGNKMVAMRKEHVVLAPELDGKALTEQYQFMWAADTKAHPATHVSPGASKADRSRAFIRRTERFYTRLVFNYWFFCS